MAISLEAISFNHDPVSATRDALTIRKNKVEDVVVPEWRRGLTRPEESPAAYTIGQISANRLTLKAQFRRQEADQTSVQVYAVARAGNVLGNVKSRTIRFENGLSAFELFDLESPYQNLSVGVNNIGWDWFIDGTYRQTTEHRIYTILNVPQAPWGQADSSFPEFQLPWTEVLEHACREAAGATNVNEAAAMLTRWVYSLGQSKLRYDDYGSGSSNFTIGGMKTFRCTKFLQALAEGIATTARVNCTDCATILSSFANILGCDLTQSRIGGGEFETNRIQKIGVDSTIRQPFRFHEVAWKFPREGTASLYDCCLRVDGDADPTDDIFSATLGINMPLGVPGRSGYYFRLIAPTTSDQVSRELFGTRVRRKIEGQTATRITLDPEQRRQLEDEYDFSEWQGTPPSDPKQVCRPQYKKPVVNSEKDSASEHKIFLKNYSWNKGLQSVAGWTPGDIESFEAKPDPLRLTDVVWRSNGCSGARLRVLTYECSSISAARFFLLTLLGEFNLPGIKRRLDFVVSGKQVKIGDVAFAGLDDLVLLFARANNVILIQNAGGTFVPVSQFALAVDTEMESGLDPKTVETIEMKQFQVSDKQIRVGDEVRIHTREDPITKEKQTLFKFFAPAGEVYLKGNDLLYRCQVAGDQSLTILAQEAGGKSARQVLKLFAEPPALSEELYCPKTDEPNIEEESVMPDITGVWSSIRPTNNGDNSPVDMTADGYIEIRSRDARTGEITGFYTDSGRSPVRNLRGRVTLMVPNSFRINLSHPVRPGITRHYEGQLVASDDNDDFGVQIVAGRYSDVIEDSEVSGTTTTSSSALVAADGGQDNGTWVATKP
jgi:hypothetical protein